MSIKATLIWDFDGTVCLGNDPETDFARRLASRLEPVAAEKFMQVFMAFRNGKPTTASTFDADDTYHVVRILAREHGIDDEVMQAEFLRTRNELGAGKYPSMHLPEGFHKFIFSMPRSIESILVSNSPEAGQEGIIEQLRLDGLFDDIIFDAGKPAGMDTIIDSRLANRDPRSLLCIGDIPRNDLAAAADRGAYAVYVDHYDRPWSKADATGRSTEELFPFIFGWANDIEQKG